MPVPSEKEIRRPILEAVKGESPQSFSINDFLKIIAEHFGENLHDMSSLDKTTLKAYITDAKTYLRINKLISNPSKQTYMITKAGEDILAHTEGIIDDECLKNFAASRSTLEPEKLPELPPLVDTVPELPDAIDMTEEPAESETPPEVEDIAETPNVEEPAIDAPTESETLPEVEDAEPVEEQAANVDVEELTTEEPAAEEFDSEQQENSESESEAVPETEYLSEAETPQEPQEELDEQDYTDDTNGDEDMPETNMPAENNEDIEDVLARHNEKLAERVLARTAELSSDTFEVLVTDLLSKMGYRVFANARYTNGASDNGMIQGVILDSQDTVPIYIHAQKLSPGRSVGRADVQDFVEALADKGGKGIFATTAEFSESAVQYAQDERIMLIDGAKLAGLMIAHNFCVNVERVFEVKELDEDSFNDYES